MPNLRPSIACIVKIMPENRPNGRTDRNMMLIATSRKGKLTLSVIQITLYKTLVSYDGLYETTQSHPLHETPRFTGVHKLLQYCDYHMGMN